MVKHNFMIIVSVMFIPPITTALVQCFDQEIIANVKAPYARETFAFLDATINTHEEIAAMEENHALVTLPPLEFYSD